MALYLLEADATVDVLYEVIISLNDHNKRYYVFIVKDKPMLIYAYQAGWRQFVSLALAKFNPFIEEDSITFASYAEEVWLFIMKETHDELVGEVTAILDKYIDRVSLLTSVKDTLGRKAIDMASPKYKEAMLERLFLFQRYEIRDGVAEHESETCIVRLAIDHKDGGRNVALKFIRNRDDFEREVSFRQKCDFDVEFVVSCLRLYDGDDDDQGSRFGNEAVRKGYYRYCLVMPAAERNLGAVIAYENIAERDWDQLRLISEQLLEALHHVHQKGYIHGDVKRT